MKLYILTSDKLIDKTCQLVELNYKKYWPEIDIVILGYSTPKVEIKNFEFVSLGADNGPKTICSQLTEYFKTVDDEYFIIGVDDVPFVERVNHNLFIKIVDVVKSDNLIGRFGLTKDNLTRTNSEIKKYNEFTLFQNSQNVKYRLSCTYSIWNKKFFLEYSNKCTDLWDFEVRGSELSQNSNWKIIGSNPWVLNFSHIFKRGVLKPNWYKGIGTDKELSEEDQKIIKNIYNI